MSVGCVLVVYGVVSVGCVLVVYGVVSVGCVLVVYGVVSVGCVLVEKELKEISFLSRLYLFRANPNTMLIRTLCFGRLPSVHLFGEYNGRTVPGNFCLWSLPADSLIVSTIADPQRCCHAC